MNKKNSLTLLSFIFYLHACTTQHKLPLELDYSDSASSDNGTIEFVEHSEGRGSMNLVVDGRVIFFGSYSLSQNDKKDWEYIYYSRLKENMSDVNSFKKGGLRITTDFGCDAVQIGKEYHYNATFKKDNGDRLRCAFVGDAPNTISSGKGVCIDTNNNPTLITFGKFYLQEKAACEKNKLAMVRQSNIFIEPHRLEFEPDIDNNHIRDDIDNYINRTLSKDEEIKAFSTDYAKTYQEFLTNYDNSEKIKPIYKTLQLMNACLNIGRPSIKPNPLDEIESQLMSTPDMLHAYHLARKSQSEMQRPIVKDELYSLCDHYFPVMSKIDKHRRTKLNRNGED